MFSSIVQIIFKSLIKKNTSADATTVGSQGNTAWNDRERACAWNLKVAIEYGCQGGTEFQLGARTSLSKVHQFKLFQKLD
jgi:hypothetical protein